MKILVLDKLSAEAREIFKSRGLEVEEKLDLKGQALLDAVSDCDALLIRSSSQIDAPVLEAAKKLKVVGRAGVGVDNVDVKAATRKGVIVMNTPGASTTTTAELAVAMVLSLSRNIAQADASMKKGEWKRTAFVGRELYGKQAGIIGLGRIGLGVALRLQKLGMKVIAFDPYASQEVADRYEIKLVDLPQLLSSSDFISMHAALTETTKYLLGAKEFALLKKGAMIVNCARGELINEKELLDALNQGLVGGAGLDVFEQEPPDPNHPLIKHPKVIATPHLGASTVEAQGRVAVEIAQQVADALLGGEVRNAVNLATIEVEVATRAKKFVELTQSLSSVVAQLGKGRPAKIEIELGGMPSDLPRSLLRSTCVTTILRRFLDSGIINNVNAAVVAEERGIEVREIQTATAGAFTNVIRVSLTTDQGTRSVAGTVFPHGALRFIELDGFLIDAPPSPFMLITTNQDIPGVIGKLGTLLGHNSINIGGMQLGRLQGGQKAVSILNIDSEVPTPVLEAIRQMPEILESNFVRITEG